MSESFESWWSSLGAITKRVLVISVAISAAVTSRSISPYLITADFSATVFSFQIWRIVTAVFYLGNFSFPWLMALAMLVTYTKYHEETEFKGRRADFIWMLTMIISFLTLCAWILSMPVVSFAFTMSLCWIFCKRNPSMKLSIYFFAFDANIFPWALMAFHVVLGQSIVDDLVGIVAGHGYLFLSDMLPKTHGIELVRTPVFLQNWIPQQRTRGTVHRGVEVVEPAGRRLGDGANGPAPQRHNWGQGRALGAR